MTNVVVAGGDARAHRRFQPFTVTLVPTVDDPRCAGADVVVLEWDADRDAAAPLRIPAGGPPVLVTGASLLRPDIWMARRCGARGYVARNEDPRPAVDALRAGQEHWPAGLGQAPEWLAEEDPLRRFAVFTRVREHARYARMLHDTVLQTLEGLTLAASTDPAARELLTLEAAQLREFIAHPHGNTGRGPGIPLAGALHEVATAYRREGLRVTLSVEDGGDPAAATTDTLTEAVREALRNVVKHAGTDRATVVVTRPGRAVRVRVSDAGHGFDPDGVAAGFGLTESIGARLREVGGTAVVDATPGSGTTVELTVPIEDRLG